MVPPTNQPNDRAIIEQSTFSKFRKYVNEEKETFPSTTYLFELLNYANQQEDK